MTQLDKAEITKLIKERKIKFVGKGEDHIIANELDINSVWETLENGFLVTKEQLCKRFPDKESNYKWPDYFLYKLRKFWITGKPVLLGFYIQGGFLRIAHFSGCSAEAKFYDELKKESQNFSPKN